MLDNCNFLYLQRCFKLGLTARLTPTKNSIAN